MNSFSMLLKATKQGRVFMVNYLLESSEFNINETDNEGKTPLIIACLFPDNMAAIRRKLVRLFLSKNADVNVSDKSGRNALMWACYLGEIDVVKILFDRSLVDLNFNCVDFNGNTALHYVASAGHCTLTSMMVEAMQRFGLNIDRRNNDGITPLLAATKNRNELCAGILLDHGASPNIVDSKSLMNVKELAENGKLTSLVEKIAKRNPTNQSRCSIPRLPSNDLMRLAMHRKDPRCAVGRSVKTSKGPTLAKRGPLSSLSKRITHHSKFELEPQHTSGNSLAFKSRNPFLTQATESECCSSVVFGNTKSAYPGTELKGAPIPFPYDLRSIQGLLALYGEQISPNYRKGYAVPTMSEEGFRACLEAMKPKPQSRGSSRARCSSSSSVGPSLVPQRPLRSSTQLGEYSAHRSSELGTWLMDSPKPKDSPLVRNMSDLSLDSRSPVQAARRHSLVTSTAQFL